MERTITKKNTNTLKLKLSELNLDFERCNIEVKEYDFSKGDCVFCVLLCSEQGHIKKLQIEDGKFWKLNDVDTKQDVLFTFLKIDNNDMVYGDCSLTVLISERAY